MKKRINILLTVLLLSTGLFAQGYSLDFDGSNDYVAADIPIPTGGFTYSAWVKFDTAIRKESIFSVGGNNQLILYKQSNGKLTVMINNVELIVESSATNTDRHHIALTRNGTNVTLYRDGVSIGSSTSATSGALSFGSCDLLIGSDSDDGCTGDLGDYLDGRIDEVRIWDDVRTLAEIQANMHIDLAGSESNLVAYYKMSNGSGTSLTDNSSNSYTGTLTNMDNNDWVTSNAPIGDLNSSYETDVEAIWKVSGTSASDASDGLTMTVSSALSTGNFAVFGNNNTSGTSASDIGNVASTHRTGRIWQVDESGTVAGTVTIDISDATGNAGQSGTASNFRLLYRSGTSGDFSSAATGASISGDAVSFTSVSLADGYYALGAESDASLPVELTSFTSTNTRAGEITLHWITESEINNLGFILERRSTPDALHPGEWEEIASYVTHSDLQGQGSVSYQTEYSYTDETLIEGLFYDYRLADVSYEGIKEYHTLTVLGVSVLHVPQIYSLHQAYPNPFNPVTSIRYDIAEQGHVTLRVYDMNGRLVETLVDHTIEPGTHTIQWKPINMSSGLYFSRLTAGHKTFTRKMILLK